MTMSGLLSRVPSEPSSEGPDWLAGLRKAAAAHLHERGFPGKKHESWRFTSVREIVDTAFTRGAGSEGVVARVDEALGDDGTWRLVIAGETPLLDAAGAPPPGVTVRSLARVLAEEPALVAPVLGKLVAGEHFAALSNALFEDGVVLVVSGDIPTPVHLVHTAGGGEEPSATYPRVVVIAREGSRATLVESFLDLPANTSADTSKRAARHLTNAVAEIAVGANARLEHIRISEGTERTLSLAYLGVSLARDAFYGSRVVTLGGALTRLELGLRFDGPGGEADLDGAYHVDDGEHVDHQIRVDHVAGRCTSHVRYRGLLDGNGHAVFNAMGIVHRNAAGSAAHQENRNLLLSDGATIDTKPHLEIDCDDVAASHGTTVGAIDDAQLFYLRARGVPEAQARDILTYAFVSEILGRIGHPPLVARTSRATLARLPHGEALGELVG